MRIDEIDLFGPMLVNGSTGSNGQVFGFSGSEITWITASSSGGDGAPGPQGPVGIGLFIPEDQIAIGGPSGLTSTVFFKTDGYNIIHGSSSVGGSCNTILGSHQFITPSATVNSIAGGFYNTIIGGYSNTITLSNRSFIGGGRINSMSYQNNSAMLGGSENQILSTNPTYTKNNIILSGCNNTITGGNCRTYGNTILSGYSNTIGNLYSNSYYSSIVGSENSGFTGITTLKYSAIIGGSSNTNCGVLYCSYQNAIIGGSNNFLSDSQNGYVVGGVFTKNSVTIASCDTSMRSSNSVIVSSTGYLNFYNCIFPMGPGGTRYDHVLFTSGRVGNYSMFCTYANGFINEYFYSGTFFNRSNFKGNCFVVYCGLFPPTGRNLAICF